MAEPDRLRRKQVAILARLQAYRDEQANRRLTVARWRVADAEHAIQAAEQACERERLEQTQARSHRWRNAVGKELEYDAIWALRAEDENGFSVIEQHDQHREKAKQAAAEARDAVKNAEQEARTVHTALARRNALQQTVEQECRHYEQTHEELRRDQQSQMVFAHCTRRSPI
ncbi:ribonuclease D [Acetobacter tropicalis]|uniref:hypothetical protein n=1 Tax=Acetobacter tropicalis TaxID=104102 RepID=UPI0007724B23|nr:hypothetical protein [Acetobacter tropicalis]